MELHLKDQLFIVGGASSGFGRSIAEALVKEGANVIAVARNEEKLNELQALYKGKLEILVADITQELTAEKLVGVVNGRQLHGILVNAGGPPAMTVLESTMQDWDNAYQTVLRWKVRLLQAIVPQMLHHKYGRVVFVESAAVKQPMENLVLSNAFRLAVVGFMKTFSQELASNGITLNALAPGYHDTAALERIIKKKSSQTGTEEKQVKQALINEGQVGMLGNPDDFASLALWLLSGSGRYVTGQTISVAGAVIKGVMG